MKKKMISMAMMALMALTACTTDEPEPNPIDVETDPNVAIFEYESITDFQFWPSPSIDDSNLQGEGYDFAYWKQHKAEAQTFEEMMDMCNIPKEILASMSTRNLAITCFNYPYNPLFSAYNDEYTGFLNTISHFNGYAELMKRKSGLQATLDIYADTELMSSALTYDWAWTFFVCSAVDHKVLSSAQVSHLSQVVTTRIDEAESISLAFAYLLGGFIAYHYDSTLPEEQLFLLKSYLGFSGRFVPVDKPTDRISSIISKSLNRLATQAE